MVVAEIHAHRCACRRHQLVKLEALSFALVKGDVVGSVVDDGDELAVVLLDASRVAADATLPMCRERLEENVGAGVIDFDLVGDRIIGHDDSERNSTMASLNTGDSCGKNEYRCCTAKAY